MPFIPHTENDVRQMLEAIGASSIEQLFDEIPPALRINDLPGIPDGISEMEITRLMHERARRDSGLLNFIGAGAYEHHIPAAVWQIATRGEFYSAYTPYQAEASQGTLQLIYEYQSMMTALTGMDVSNASLYDGASALAEAALMAVRANPRARSRHLVLCGGVHPVYRDVTHAIAASQGITLQRIDVREMDGRSAIEALDSLEKNPVAVVIQQPSFFGTLEDVDAITDKAHALGALVIAVVNPLSLSLLKPPGEWGETGADIVCGEGQPLGVPLSSGGPYFGFMACRSAIVRQLPGRIVGRTLDLDGKPGFTLTLQAREQHIRRSRATSNICTNQGLAVTAATIYMALLGGEGLARVATACRSRLEQLVSRLESVGGVRRKFTGPHFHEAVLTLDRPAKSVLAQLADAGIAGGIDLHDDYPEFGDAMLVCATETRTAGDIERYAVALEKIMTSGAHA